MGRFWTVFKREYLSRVKTKAFWIGTALMPVFMFAVTVLPSLMAEKQSSVTIGIQDRTGRIFDDVEARLAKLADFGDAYEIAVLSLDRTADGAALDSIVVLGEIDAYVEITPESVTSGALDYRGKIVTNVIQQQLLRRVLSDALTADRVRAAGYSAEELDALETQVHLQTIDVTKSDDQQTGDGQIIVAFVLFLALYIMLIIYGAYILRAVLEEKSSRIVEVVLSSLRPIELLVGKVTAMGAVGLTQMLVWVAAGAALNVGGKSGLFEIAGDIPMPSGGLLAHFLALFIFGFAIYGGLFAAIAAVHNNEQEAQQFQWVAMAPLIMSTVFMFQILNAPDSTLATVLTFIPVFTPLIMLGRIATGAMSTAHIAIGYVVLFVFTGLQYVFVARIYRVGILMYGKRPTPKELLRWMTY
jgi:ABC-2 type transport system permease protein